MAKSIGEQDSYRFGGHQSFALRTAWLPKAAAEIEAGRDPLTDPLKGVVSLGLGKNMVEALRIWVEAYGVAERPNGIWELTSFGSALLGRNGFDRYLEDEQTLWLLHWKIATSRRAPFFAWELLVNRWNEPQFTAADILLAFAREAERAGRPLSPVSARQHFDVWLHTYLPARAGRGEDGIDSPLSALGLVRRMGEREASGGRREQIYGFDLDAKHGIGSGLFELCLHDWWDQVASAEATMPLADIAFGRHSPGRVFRMPEIEVRDRLSTMASAQNASIELVESLNQYLVRRKRRPEAQALMERIYDLSAASSELIHA